jgi:hypothetical protein
MVLRMADTGRVLVWIGQPGNGKTGPVQYIRLRGLFGKPGMTKKEPIRHRPVKRRKRRQKLRGIVRAVGKPGGENKKTGGMSPRFWAVFRCGLGAGTQQVGMETGLRSSAASHFFAKVFESTLPSASSTKVPVRLASLLTVICPGTPGPAASSITILLPALALIEV